MRQNSCGGQLQAGGYRQGSPTEAEAVGPGSMKRENDFSKRGEEELQSPGRQSYRSGWMVMEWEGTGRDESRFHGTSGYMTHRGIRRIKMKARNAG